MKKYPIDYVPDNSWLTYVKQTIKGQWAKGKIIQKAKAFYRCKCGKEIECFISAVKEGKKTSCGCKHRVSNINNIIHGLSSHPLYGVWNTMKQRCYNKRNKTYPFYGAIGVRVCSEWYDDFKVFYDWAINNGWKVGLELDKDIKPKEAKVEALLYSPEWCQFVTNKENGSAKRSNVYIEYKGKRQTIMQWSQELGIDRHTITRRLKIGFSPEIIFSKSKLPRKYWPDYKPYNTGKKIKQIDIESGTVVKVWNSVKDATISFGLKSNGISGCLKKKKKISYGFKWEYA